MRFYLLRALTEGADFCCVNYYNDGISCKGMISNLFVKILAIYNGNVKTLTVKLIKEGRTCNFKAYQCIVIG